MLLFVLFHPRSPLPHFYGSSTLTPGTFSPSGAIVPNPLPSGAKFGDVPFASLGASLAEETPGWAGGDDGAAKLEGGGGNGARWNGTHWWDRTVLLVSLDGLRADYLTKGLTPNLVGVSKRGLVSGFALSEREGDADGRCRKRSISSPCSHPSPSPITTRSCPFFPLCFSCLACPKTTLWPTQHRPLPRVARHRRQRLLGSSDRQGICLHRSDQELVGRMVGWRARAC